MKKTVTLLTTILLVMFVAILTLGVSAAEVDNTSSDNSATVSVETQEETEAGDSDVLSMKAIAAAFVVAVVGAAGAIGMAMAISKSAESMARQPEMASKINSTMMLGIVFIETAIIYALIVAILIIFVL